MDEVWVLQNLSGQILPPIDDDGTDVFLAWPSQSEAEKGLEHQRQWLEDRDTYRPVRIK